MWDVEALDYITGKYYPSVLIQDQEPSGGLFRNVRKAEIDFSGIVIRLGIRIRLGKVPAE